MQHLLAITKALSDATRLRALMSLQGGELCLCQIIEVIGLAPSTVSRHMAILLQAGLVQRRKEGRWQYYRFAGRLATPQSRQILKWVCASLSNQATIKNDARKLRRICKKDLKDLCQCYRS